MSGQPVTRRELIRWLCASATGLMSCSDGPAAANGTGGPAPIPGGGGAVGNLFSVRWTSGMGNGTNAVSDGGKFSNVANGLVGGTGTRTLDVVSAASVDADHGTLAGYVGNVLRMRMRQAGYGQMTAIAVVPRSTTHYARIYYRSDAGRRSQHGSGYIASAGGSFNHWQILQLEHWGGTDAAAEWTWAIRTGGAYPSGRYHSPWLTKGVWYRFEWMVEYVTATTVKVWPRIYDLTGALLYHSDDFTHEERGSSLTAFWASNTLTIGFPDDAPNADEARDFTLGLEDPSDAIGYDPATPAHICVTCLDFSSTNWLGP